MNSNPEAPSSLPPLELEVVSHAKPWLREHVGEIEQVTMQDTSASDESVFICVSCPTLSGCDHTAVLV